MAFFRSCADKRFKYISASQDGRKEETGGGLHEKMCEESMLGALAVHWGKVVPCKD